MRRFVAACALGACVLQSSAAVAATKDFALQNYALPADKPVTVVLMRPDVEVGELQAGGLPQPNAEWTEAARAQLTKALRSVLNDRKLDFAIMEDRISAYRTAYAAAAEKDCVAARSTAEAQARAAAKAAGQDLATFTYSPPADAPDCAHLDAAPPIDAEARVAEYNGLHEAVAQAILAHKYGLGAGKLPTKKDGFEYTLGTGTAALEQVSGANYGLFVTTRDEFASSSRKAMQVMGALGCLVGACVLVGGGIHVGYVSLVDLETGKIVWFNLLRGSQGDVREEDGARNMVAAILASMPTRPGERTAQADAVKR